MIHADFKYINTRWNMFQMQSMQFFFTWCKNKTSTGKSRCDRLDVHMKFIRNGQLVLCVCTRFTSLRHHYLVFLLFVFVLFIPQKECHYRISAADAEKPKSKIIIFISCLFRFEFHFFLSVFFSSLDSIVRWIFVAIIQIPRKSTGTFFRDKSVRFVFSFFLFSYRFCSFCCRRKRNIYLVLINSLTHEQKIKQTAYACIGTFQHCTLKNLNWERCVDVNKHIYSRGFFSFCKSRYFIL